MNKLLLEENDYLNHKISAFYHGTHKSWNDTQVGFINTLKNDDGTFSNAKKEFGFTLFQATQKLYDCLGKDLPEIAKDCDANLTICVVPRSNCNAKYNSNQLLFSNTIKKFVLDNLKLFNDGTDYITRIQDTPTTHLTRDYNSVEVGITKETCEFSSEIKGKDILLIDDIYTNSVNIDEDAIQALFDKGAKSVIFYSLGKTV